MKDIPISNLEDMTMNMKPQKNNKSITFFFKKTLVKRTINGK